MAPVPEPVYVMFRTFPDISNSTPSPHSPASEPDDDKMMIDSAVRHSRLSARVLPILVVSPECMIGIPY